jgi:ketosteroid isomerase-like protein
MLREWAPDGVVDWSNSRGVDAHVFRGADQIRVFAERFFESFAEGQVEIVGMREIEPGVLIVDNLTRFRGREGIEVEARAAFLITIRGGVQTSLTLYQTEADLATAGGSE